MPRLADPRTGQAPPSAAADPDVTVLPADAPRRLRATVLPVASVGAGTRARAWNLFAAAYTGADRTRFERDFAAKQRVILLHDPADGSLQGFSTVAVTTLAGGTATVVFSGDTVIAPAYWGSKVLQQAFAALLVREKLRHPGRPLYWFLISKGYKTYLMLARAFPRSVPRADHRRGDAELRRVLDVVAGDRFGAAYDADNGIIRHATPLEAVRAGLCPIDAELLADPDIAFFVQRNPGHVRGDELACLAKVRLRDAARQILRSAAHRSRGAGGGRR